MRQAAPRVGAIDPTKRGFAFAVLEGSERLVDWGLAHVWSKNDREFLARVESFLDRHMPGALVLEGARRSRRGSRARRRIDKVAALAKSRRLPVFMPTRRDIRRVFEPSGATKWEIAVAISLWFPELEARLPPKRQLWMSEDERMNIFDAVSLALTALRDAGK